MKRVLVAIGAGLYLAVLTEAAAEMPMSPIYRSDPRSQSAGQPKAVPRKPTISAPVATADTPATADIPPLAPAAVTETAPTADAAASSPEQRGPRAPPIARLLSLPGVSCALGRWVLRLAPWFAQRGVRPVTKRRLRRLRPPHRPASRAELGAPSINSNSVHALAGSRHMFSRTSAQNGNDDTCS
jgi:hypothetical protein